MPERETVKCHACELNQFKRDDNLCRRCGKPLTSGNVIVTRVIYLALPPTHVNVTTLREAMAQYVVHAVSVIPHTTKAAAALGIPHGRLKQLLREAGDCNDRRNEPKGKQ